MAKQQLRTRPRRSSTLTPRQQQVVTLIARGATNKEIAYELGITERGVSAQVSRLLLRFGTPNRTGLIATVMSHSTNAGVDLHAFDNSPLFVTITFGRDQVIAYQNKATQRLVAGIDPRSMLGRPGAERFPDRTAEAIRKCADESFVRGVTLTTDAMPVRWTRDDGTEGGGVISWVLQPLRDASGEVEGILWIGASQPLIDTAATHAPEDV